MQDFNGQSGHRPDEHAAIIRLAHVETHQFREILRSLQTAHQEYLKQKVLYFYNCRLPENLMQLHKELRNILQLQIELESLPSTDDFIYKGQQLLSDITDLLERLPTIPEGATSNG